MRDYACVRKQVIFYYYYKIILWFFKLRRISKHGKGMTDASYSNRIPDWTCRSLIGTCGPCGTDTNPNEK